jgi:hypothetical protein
MVTRTKHSKHKSNAQVLANLRAISMEEMLSAARLKDFKRLFLAFLKAEDGYEESWFGLIRDDCWCLQKVIPNEVPSKDPQEAPEKWSYFVCCLDKLESSYPESSATSHCP